MSLQATIAYGSVSQCPSSRMANSSEPLSIEVIGRRWILSGRKRFWRICGGAETLRGRSGRQEAKSNGVDMPTLRERSQSQLLQSGNVTARQFSDRAAGQ